VGEQTENHSSRGIIVSTGLGSTAWLKSILAGTAGIAGTALHKKIKFKDEGRFAWDADYLCYSVREPFPSKTSGTSLVFGKITRKKPLLLESQMGGNGVIFSDGIEANFLEFNSGMRAKIGIAEKCGHLVV
jgi:hypothetical protein